MVCRKTYGDTLLALFVLTLIMLSSGLTCLGMIRYTFKLDDDQYINRNHLILSGTSLSILALLGSTYILVSSGDGGILTPLLIASMFFLLILIIYLSNYDPTDPGSQWTVIVSCVLDIYVKVSAVLLGYGVCSVEEVPRALIGMGKTIMGGRG
jgi:hypothetical protein